MMSGIILSAGLSSRFSSPKALAELPTGDNVILHLQKMLVETSLNELIVVLGAHYEAIKPCVLNHSKIRFVYNNHYNLGQTSSFKTGLRTLSDQTEGIMLFPVDYPAVKPETVEAMIRYFHECQPLLLIPTFNHLKGHPLLFHMSLKKDFLSLDDALGLNTIAQHHLLETVLFPVEDAGVVASFNTLEEWDLLRKEFFCG